MLQNLQQFGLKLSRHRLSIGFIQFMREFIRLEVAPKAKALTYTSLFALVPIIALMLAIISSVAQLASSRDKLMQIIYSNILPEAAVSVEQYLSGFAAATNQLTLVGGAVLFVTCGLLFQQIEVAFNHIWRTTSQRTGMQTIKHYWLLITIAPLCLAVIVGGISAIESYQFIPTIGQWIDAAPMVSTQLVSTIWLEMLSLALTVVGFALLFWAIPSVHVPAMAALLAGLVASVFFVMQKMLFAWFFDYFSSYKLVYGAFVAFPLLLIWLYWLWLIVLGGVLLSRMLANPGAFGNSKQLLPVLERLQVIGYLNHAQPGRLKGFVQQGYGQAAAWQRAINYCLANNLVAETVMGEYVLLCSVDKMCLDDIVDDEDILISMYHSAQFDHLSTQVSAREQQLLVVLKQTAGAHRAQLQQPLVQWLGK